MPKLLLALLPLSFSHCLEEKLVEMAKFEKKLLKKEKQVE
jgi:hypothetical protein